MGAQGLHISILWDACSLQAASWTALTFIIYVEERLNMKPNNADIQVIMYNCFTANHFTKNQKSDTKFLLRIP